jgi:hypothetical protein
LLGWEDELKAMVNADAVQNHDEWCDKKIRLLKTENEHNFLDYAWSWRNSILVNFDTISYLFYGNHFR